MATRYSNYSGYNADPYDDIRDGMTATKTTTGPNSRGVQQVAYNPYRGELGGAPAAAAPGAPQPAVPQGSPQGTNTGNPYQSYIDALNAQAAAETARRRANVFDEMKSVFASFGIDPDGSLASLVQSWVNQDKSAPWMMMEFRKTDAYNKRFTGMADLIKRGQFMDEATYIAQERSYRAVLQAYDLPAGFYDGPEDFGRFIANGVSAAELEDRVASAKTFMDDTTDPAYKQYLQQYAGITEGGMLAWVLDGDRAQSTLQKQLKAAQIAGSAAKYGYDLSADQAAQYGSALGAQYDRFGADAKGQLEQMMGSIDQIADQDERLASIDNEAYNRTDALDQSLLNDTGKQLASRKRAQREQARFGGTSAVNQGTLSRGSGA